MTSNLFKFIGTMIISLIIFTLLILIFIKIKEHINKNDEIIYTLEDELLVENSEFNDSLFYNYLLSINIMHPNIVYSQACLETGHFTSRLFKENNNLFGMKIPKQRATLNIGDLEFAKFNNWKECVLDYAIWQAKYCSKFKTEDEYLNYLQKVYAENKLYKKLLLNMMRKNGNYISK